MAVDPHVGVWPLHWIANTVPLSATLPCQLSTVIFCHILFLNYETFMHHPMPIGVLTTAAF